MPRYRCYGRVVVSKYLGEYEADSGEKAREKAFKEACCSLCHQCAGECDDPEIDEVTVELVEEEPAKKGRKK